MLTDRRPSCRRARAVAALFVAAATTAVASAQSVPSPQFPKRGWGGTVNSAYNSNRVNANWYYTWGRVPVAGSYAEFVPMAWNGIAVSDPARLAELTSHSSEYILGFNEPERAEQANMTVDQALALWPTLMAASNGKKLVSPAVGADASGRAWIAEFMSKASALNAANPGTIRIDAIAMHWYGDVRVTNAYTGLSNTIDVFHNTYTLNGQKLPIWLTEFAGLDFTNGADPVTEEDNRRFLAGALPLLDAKAHLHRYAWFNWRPEAYLGTLPAGAADVPESPYTTTTPGDLYNGRTYSTGQIYSMTGTEGTDTFYMRAGTIENTSGAAKTVRAIDFMGPAGSSVQGSVDVNVGDWMRIRSGITVGKRGTNNLNFVGSTLFNDGVLSGKTGFMVFSDGAVAEGTGAIRTEWNADAGGEGIILTESAPGAGGATINNRIWLNGGQYLIPAGSHTHNGELTLSSNSFANVAGNLTMNGPMTSTGTLGKSGTGTLRLNSGASTNTGAFSVSAGTLVVGNETGSAHGLGSLTIGVNGTLAGNGTLGGTSVTVNGTLAPSKVTDRPRALTFNSPLTFGANARTVMDVGLIVPDSVLSTSTVTLNGTLQLVPSVLPADLVPMTLFTATSVVSTFDVVEGVQLAGSPARALAVTYSATGVVVTKTLPGDATVNGVVNFDDLLVLAANYNGSGKTWAGGDFTGDGTVNFDDLLVLAGQYNASIVGTMGMLSAPGAFALVPEPSALLWLPAAALLTRRRR